MAAITPPTIFSNAFGWSLVRGDVAQRMMSGREIIFAPPLAFWQAQIDLVIQDETTHMLWTAFAVQMSRLENWVEITPTSYSGPTSGYAGADPLVAGASQLGNTIAADGVSISTLILKAGNFLTIGGELKVATSDATSSGSGAVTINFEPALRNSPADNAVIEIQAPTVKMRFAEPVAQWDGEMPKFYRRRLQLVESIL